MSRPFLKMNGLGNDFVVVEARSAPGDAGFRPAAEQVRAWADRTGGIGFDQLIAIEGSDRGDAFMRVWNADGGVVETCGNALRCVGWLLMQATGKGEVAIDTLGGLTRASAAGDLMVSVDMGETACKVPLATEYIEKIERLGRVGKKRKTIKC